MTSLLSVEDLEVNLTDPLTGRTGRVLRGVDLSLAAGERLALVGESGCGKSVTALSVLHLLPSPPMRISGGAIRFNGRDLGTLSEREWREVRGREIGIVFQDPLAAMNPVLTAGEQTSETLRLHLGLAEEAARKKVHELFREVGLADPERIFSQHPHQLSGGMCQRVMIAMAVACGPALLIADEPTTALDVTVQSQILELLTRMTERHRLAVLLITHDLRIVRGHADRVAILYAGQVVETGAPREIFDHPQHPYTEGLLSCLPEFSRKDSPLFTIPGTVPSPYEEVLGCSFAPRCSRAQARCRAVSPPLDQAGEGHQVRCFYPSGK